MTVQYPMVSILGLPIIIIIIITYLIGIGLAVWVYNDAKKRDMNAAVWLLIVLLTSFIGWVIFLRVRE